jgi:hypothetical protein
MQIVRAHNKNGIYLAVCIATMALSLWVAITLPDNWDVAWRIEVSQRMLNHAVLYRDIIELNPPLWFWSAVPSTYFAQVFHIKSQAMLFCVIHVSTALGVWLLDRVCVPILAPINRKWLVVGALVALLLLPSRDLGQRELPVLLAGLLWGALAVRRAEGVASPLWLTVGVVLFSAYGFALKHYYLAIPIGLEIWLALTLKRRWQLFRLETLLLGGLGALYGAILLAFTPEFFTDIVPLTHLSYKEVRFRNTADSNATWDHLQSQAFPALIALVFILPQIQRHRIGQVMALTTLLHIVAVVLQGKGFFNHFLATNGATLVLLAWACSTASRTEMVASVPSIVLLGVLTFVWVVQPLTPKFEQPISHYSTAKPQVRPAFQAAPRSASEAVVGTILQEPKEARIFVVSTNAGYAFFVPWRANRPQFSRYYALWMLPGLVTAELDPKERARALAFLGDVRANTISDIKCAAPKLIIGDVTTHGRTRDKKFESYDIDPMQILLKDKAFQAWLDAHYTKAALPYRVTTWRAKDPVNLKPGGCTAHIGSVARLPAG